MDHPTLDERLPTLYREILDAVGELEHRGLRSDALRARRRATRAYTTWDERAERHLASLLVDLRQRLDAPAGGERGMLRGRARLRGARAGSATQPSA